MKMSSKKRYKKNISWTLFSNLVYILSQWLIITLIARFGSPTMVGEFALALAITTPIIIFMNMQLRLILVTDHKEVYSFNEYITFRIYSGIGTLIIYLILLLIFPYDDYMNLIILIMGLSKIIDSFSDLIYGDLQIRELNDVIGKSIVIKSIIIFVSSIISLLLFNNILALVIFNFFVYIGMLFGFDKKQIDNKKFSLTKLNKTKFKNMCIVSIPLTLTVFLESFNNNITRFLLERFTSIEELGYFSVLVYIVIAGKTLISAIGQVNIPRLTKYFNARETKKFVNLTLLTASFATLIGVLGYLIVKMAGERIINFVYGPEYVNYIPLLELLMIWGILSYLNSSLNFSINAAREFRINLINGIGTSLLVILGSLVMLPLYGLIGIAYVLIISSIFNSIFSGIIVLMICVKNFGSVR